VLTVFKDQLQSSSGTSPIVLIESKKSSDHRLSVPLSVDRSAPMSVRKPAIEASSPRKRTTKISEQRGRTKFTKEDDELLLKSVREARKQGRNLWDKYYSVWEEHVKKHVSPTLSQPRHTAKSCRDRYRKYYYNTGLHWLTAPPEELLDEGSVVEVPHLSGLGVRPRKPRYSLILQRDLKPPVPTTSEDISGATKRVDLRSRRQVAKRNIPGTVSWTEAENHLEVHDLVQHAGLLGEASTTGKPLDVQGTRTAHPASHISSLERIGHGNGHSFPYIMTPPHSISSVTCATPISDRSSSFDPDSSRSVCVSLSRLAPCKSAGRTPFKDLVINQVDPAYSFSDEEEIETHSDVGQPSIQNRASVGFMARAVSRNCDVDAVLPASLRRPDTIRRTQPVSANKDSPQAPSPASSIKARQGTTASKISSPPRTQSMYKANTPVQLACKKRKRTHRQILDLDDIDELA
jgi:hypothetical protein